MEDRSQCPKRLRASVEGPATDPSPLAPVERIAELFEMLYLREPGFTSELLQQLGNCSCADLVKLFGVPSQATSPTYGPSPADTAPEGCGEFRHVEPPAEQPTEPEPGPTWSKRGAQLPHLNAQNPGPPSWDERGYRIGPKLPSSFPRRYDPPLPRGSHWSR